MLVMGFNPRPRTGGDRGRQVTPQRHGRFNPRPRTGGDVAVASRRCTRSTFQSAPPHGGRRQGQQRSCGCVLFQSAPPHGGRPPTAVHPAAQAVSIRAPARGATRMPPVTLRLTECFNPRPRTGGDLVHAAYRLGNDRFNPRPRTGGDHGIARAGVALVVSIRAPARGATCGRCSTTRSTRRFNPRPRTGGDLLDSRSGDSPLCFNPRPRTGGDGRRPGGRGNAAVSIRAPARGATLVDEVVEVKSKFQSAPPHGGRRQRRK